MLLDLRLALHRLRFAPGFSALAVARTRIWEDFRAGTAGVVEAEGLPAYRAARVDPVRALRAE